jgi:mono/diheme cytochrome c family protein
VLQPPARYFGRDRFKFASTANGMPTDDDLKGIIARGIPGSAMPSFATLSSAEVDALIPYLRRFITAGLYDRQVQKALKDDEDPEPAKFARVAAEASIPGEVLAVPASFPAATAESIARGKALFLSEAWGCSKCHGVEGRGDGPQVKDPAFKNDDGTPAVPRDLTKGVYKGGGDPQQLYRRIRLGIPGTPMPDSKDKPEAQVVDVIHYLRSLYQGPPVTAPPAGQ